MVVFESDYHSKDLEIRPLIKLLDCTAILDQETVIHNEAIILFEAVGKRLNCLARNSKGKMSELANLIQHTFITYLERISCNHNEKPGRLEILRQLNRIDDMLDLLTQNYSTDASFIDDFCKLVEERLKTEGLDSISNLSLPKPKKNLTERNVKVKTKSSLSFHKLILNIFKQETVVLINEHLRQKAEDNQIKVNDLKELLDQISRTSNQEISIPISALESTNLSQFANQIVLKLNSDSPNQSFKLLSVLFRLYVTISLFESQMFYFLTHNEVRKGERMECYSKLIGLKETAFEIENIDWDCDSLIIAVERSLLGKEILLK